MKNRSRLKREVINSPITSDLLDFPRVKEEKDKVTLTLTGEVVSKKNARLFNVKRRKLLFSKKYLVWYDRARAELRKEVDKLVSLDYTLPFNNIDELEFIFYHKTKQRRDSDNQVTSILDLLVDLGILEDDSASIVRNYSVRNVFLSDVNRNKEDSYCEVILYLAPRLEGIPF